MAATQYQVFCRHLNENVNRIVTNTSKTEWISAEEWYQCKLAYNITDPTQTNAMKTTQTSVNTGKPENTTYRALYDEIVRKMNTVDANGNRLRYEYMSTEEQHAYDLCNRYKEILRMVGNGECTVEYAMIRPLDQMGYSYDKDDDDWMKKRQEKVSALKKNAKKFDASLYDVVYDQINNSNEKYNMLFTYAGIAQSDEQTDYYALGNSMVRQNTLTLAGIPKECLNPYTPDVGYSKDNVVYEKVSSVGVIVDAIPNIVYERMERLKMDPWFLITTCSSLKAAMTKAEQLVDLYGKDAVKIGKVVPLDQYIEIV